jgi:hypothetical protein
MNNIRKSETYLAISLNDFHSNQKGTAETNVRILFISAKTATEAANYCKEHHKDNAWSIIPILPIY